jgi:hypothetical protein
LFPPFECEPWSSSSQGSQIFYLGYEKIMSEQNLFKELASYTDAGEHTKFNLLRNKQEYKQMKNVRYSLVVLTRYLQTTADRQINNYCKDIINATTDVYKLLAYVYVNKILNFYLKELEIVSDMVYEYECYLSCLNWLDFVLDIQRPLDKLWDHRGNC